MRSFIIPMIVWGYLLSVMTARDFWANVYDRLVALLDLSPSQSWILVVLFNSIAVAIGLPQVISFIAALRRRDPMPASRQVGSSLCFVAVSLCAAMTLLSAVRLRHQLMTAAADLIPTEETDIFAAGRIADGFYSNRAVGVTIELPKAWHGLSFNSIRRAKQSGAYAVSRGDPQQAQELATKRRGMYSLLVVRRYAEPFTGYNPSLSLNAYDKKVVAATGPRTLQEYANGFTSMTHPYYVRSGALPERLGTSDGYHIHIEGRFPGATIQQHVYAAEGDKVYLVLTASIMDEADLAVLRQAISTLQIGTTR